MIEVNLLPGGKKRQAKRPAFSLALPKIGGVPTDKWMLGSGLAIVVALAFGGNLFFEVQSRMGDLRENVELAVQDSVRYADLIQKTETLQSRRDSIASKVAIIQQIDAQRYVWAHVMDEVGRALPNYTWLSNIVQVSAGDPMQFRIEGKAGNNFALTRFWNNLESSSFIRNVRLIMTEQTTERSGRGQGQGVYQFILEADMEEPPAELLTMEPLLGSTASLQGLPSESDLDTTTPSDVAETTPDGAAGLDRQ
ncbi:MAG: PilN domain-containing protein [Longimicrobiales bacterium]